MLPFQGGLEANVGIALQQLKVDFIPQYTLDGGNSVRGGQIIDYVIYVPPQAIALYCQGKYWHGGKKTMEDELKQAAAKKHGLQPVEMWEDDYETVEKARTWLKKNVV
jgi:hypothetical protein